jgi:hypothetical protein
VFWIQYLPSSGRRLGDRGHTFPTHPPYETAQHNPRRVPKGWHSSLQRLAASKDENGPRDRLVFVAVARRGGRGRGRGDLRHEDVPGGGRG